MDSVWYVYILKCADGTLYTGIAKDVKARVKKHNQSRGARFTSGRKPVHLLYSEEFPDRGKALRREAEIKKWSRQGKEQLIKYGQGILEVPRCLRESSATRD